MAKVKSGARFRLLPLTIFAAVLLLGVRVGDLWGTLSRGEALPVVAPLQAQTPPADPVAPPNPPPERAKEDGPPARSVPPGGGESGADGPVNMELIRNLSERRTQLDDRARGLDQREAMLVVAERRLQDKLIELEGVRSEIQNLLRTLDEQQKQQIMSLVKIYETMKPKDAARIFEELDRPVLLEVVQRMKEAKVAPILAAMDPTKAKDVTAALAERRQLPESARP